MRSAISYDIRDGLRDHATTVGGATLAGANYLGGVGFGVPRNGNEWAVAIISGVIALLGALFQRPGKV